MSKKAYTVTLDVEVAERAQELTDNFSGLVTKLLRKLVADNDRERIVESLKQYEQHAAARRERHGLFNEDERSFL